MFSLPTNRLFVHADVDSFYPSAEQARDDSLKGQQIIIANRARTKVIAATQNLKNEGVKAGMGVKQVLGQFPEALCLPPDFGWYDEVSYRMVEIMRDWAPDLEHYAIDNVWLDITPDRKRFEREGGIEAAVMRLQQEVREKLGITISAGVAPTKILSKMASKFKKPEPEGITIIGAKVLEEWLPRFAVSDIHGFGKKRSGKLKKEYGVDDCKEFAALSEPQVRRVLHKPGVEAWHEIRGESVLGLQKKPARKVISRLRGLKPTTDKAVVLGHIFKQLERAVELLRKGGQATGEIALVAVDVNHKAYGRRARFSIHTDDIFQMSEAVLKMWENLLPADSMIMFAGLSLGRLSQGPRQLPLFKEEGDCDKTRSANEVLDAIKERFGRGAIQLGLSLQGPADGDPEHSKKTQTIVFNELW